MKIIAELKRRGVFQVGAAYAVVSWLLVQVASILLPTFGAPDWHMRAIILLLLIGFPIALALSWFYDLTAAGVHRTEEGDTRDVQFLPGHTLNYVIIGVLAAAVVLFALDKFYWRAGEGPGMDAEGLSIAVLPFRNMSGETANDPFTEGIHDDLLTQLSKISALRTLSRTTMWRYRDTLLSVPEIASELGVTTILEGGVQRSDNRIRINAQLIEGNTDTHLWAETYDRQLSAANIFQIQSEISRAIARALRTTLTPDEESALDRVPTENLAAYEAYVTARSRMNTLSNEDMDTALVQFSVATQLDPRFAAAWAGLCEANLGFYRRSSDQQYFLAARDACDRALELDSSLAEVHIALGRLYRFFGQYSRAEVSLQSANYARAEQELESVMGNQNLQVEALIELGLLHAEQNRLSEAEEELHRALELDPQNWSSNNSLFSFYYGFSDRPDHYELAARYAARATSLRPDIAGGWTNLGAANFMLGQYRQAADAWRRSLEIEPTRAAFTNTGLALYYTGEFAEAAEMQQRATEIAPSDHRAWGRLAAALHFMDGQEDRVRETYGKSIELARQQLEINDQDWRTLGLLSTYLVHSGQEQEALDAIGQAMQLSKRNAESLFYAAVIQLARGDQDECLELLEEAVEKDDSYRQLIAIEPAFGPLAGSERFEAVVTP
ncbi:MAG: tetratricopeptide repeat protein [Xanthomonadales bacterium]|nr:tetratricopeptide repeat protein [Xanthomonadales bacterium]NIX12816.1 tetratricopeptide repeat protein [Xanthomonadales bacterium]